MLPTEKQKLDNIVHEVISLGMLALETNQRILDALDHCDDCHLNKNDRIDKKAFYAAIDHIDNLIINVFALYAPEARDLRQLVAFLKITNEFDRIVNSCNTFIRDFPVELTDEVDKELILEYAVPLQQAAVNALTHALKLLKLTDKQAVHEHYKLVVIEESKNDDMYKLIEKSLLKKINDDMHLSREYQNIMEALRRLEKIADRALSIANLMHFAKVGGEMGQI